MPRKLSQNRKKRDPHAMPALKVIAGFVLVPAILIIAAVICIQYYRISYRNEQEVLAKELSEVKLMPDEDIRREAAKSAKMEYPVKPPSKTPAQIANEAQASAIKLADEKFNQRNLAGQVTETIKSFNEARPGQQIKFMTRTKPDMVCGTYKGKDGIFILVNTGKYSMRDIDDEFKYLFDSDAATFRTQEKIKEIRNNFKADGDKFTGETRKKIEQELYASSGYVKTDSGSWRAKSEIFDETFALLKQQKESDRQEEVRSIIQKHKLFGLFSVEPEINK